MNLMNPMNNILMYTTISSMDDNNFLIFKDKILNTLVNGDIACKYKNDIKMIYKYNHDDDFSHNDIIYLSIYENIDYIYFETTDPLYLCEKTKIINDAGLNYFAVFFASTDKEFLELAENIHIVIKYVPKCVLCNNAQQIYGKYCKNHYLNTKYNMI
jgi:hypothetical protein